MTIKFSLGIAAGRGENELASSLKSIFQFYLPSQWIQTKSDDTVKAGKRNPFDSMYWEF